MKPKGTNHRGYRATAIPAVIALILTATAWAQFPGDPRLGKITFTGPDNPAVEYLYSYDADGDGLITKTEFLKAFEAMFAIMDASGDGKLDADEVRRDPGRAYGEKSRWTAQILERFDLNDDGKLASDEAPFSAETFNRADANHDKLVTARELTQFAFELGLLAETMQMAAHPSRLAQAFLKKYDKNRDGRISGDEFEWGPDYLERFDRNGDLFLDAEEILRLPALPPSPRVQARDLIQQRDKDGNGVLSAAEFADTPERFHTADLNGDGQLTQGELTALFVQQYVNPAKARAEKRLEAPAAPPAPVPGAPNPVQPAQPPQAPASPAGPKPAVPAPAASQPPPPVPMPLAP